MIIQTRWAWILLSAIGLTGCGPQNIRFTKQIAWEIPPCPSATVIHGNIDESIEILRRAELPHNTGREKFNLRKEAWNKLYAQVGSRKYLAIGAIEGWLGGVDAMPALESQMCSEAARHGGDVVMILGQGTSETPYTMVLPGNSNTYGSASAYQIGNTAYASGSSYTSNSPGMAFSGVSTTQHANGIVLRMVPNLETLVDRLERLPDAQLGPAMQQLDMIFLNKKIDLATAINQIYALGAN
jgi:hypothetical protein